MSENSISSENEHPAALAVHDLLAACTVRRTRRSGPGGQHRNKVETAVVIEHRPTGIVAEAGERRSQEENRRQAIFRLRLGLAVNVRRDLALDAKPGALWQARCRGGKISVNSEHEDFPSIIAEALDFVAAAKFDVKAASLRLHCTPSQLTKLLQQAPQALMLVNQERTNAGLHKLR